MAYSLGAGYASMEKGFESGYKAERPAVTEFTLVIERLVTEDAADYLCSSRYAHWREAQSRCTGTQNSATLFPPEL